MSDADDASQAVSDDELDRAAGGAEEEVVETEEEGAAEEAAEDEEEVEAEEEETVEEEEAEKAPDEPEDNAERSKLGRKVSELEQLLRQSTADGEKKLTDVLEAVKSLVGKKQVEEAEEDFVMPETRDELKSLVGDLLKTERETEVKSQGEKDAQYKSDYVDTVLAIIADEDPEVRDEIIKKLDTDEFGFKLSDNGTRDAAKNVTSVIRSLGTKEKKVPIKGGKPRAPLGGGGGDKTPAKTVKVPKLDAAAQDFVNQMKISEEDQAEALTGDAKAYING